MDAGVEVKVEEYDESYDCLFCGDLVRGTAALVCRECSSNPWHRTCNKDLKYVEVCPTCNRKSVKVWTGASARTGSPSEIIDLTGEGVRGSEQRPAVGAAAARARSLRKGQRLGRRLGATGRRRVPALVRLAAAAVARGARTLAHHGRGAGGSSAERAAVEEADGGGQGTWVAQAAAGGNVSTIGEGVSAGSAEGRASASTIG